MNPRLLLHVEAAVVFVLALFVYQWHHGSWLNFGLLFLAPDLSMIGYLVNTRIGALIYNLVHTYVWPLLLASYSLETGHGIGLSIGLIWIAHIGFDRMLGFALKYATGFKDTHLSAYRHVL